MTTPEPSGQARSPLLAPPPWLYDLRETRETWFRLVDPDGQDPTPEGS